MKFVIIVLLNTSKFFRTWNYNADFLIEEVNNLKEYFSKGFNRIYRDIQEAYEYLCGAKQKLDLRYNKNM